MLYNYGSPDSYRLVGGLQFSSERIWSQLRWVGNPCRHLQSRQEAIQVPFISSITSASIWSARDKTHSAVPEALIRDTSIPLAWGYAQSKVRQDKRLLPTILFRRFAVKYLLIDFQFIAEHVLGSAVARTGLDVTITRLDYICSSADERKIASSPMDMTLDLIKTCQTLKLVPNDHLNVTRATITDAISNMADLICHNLEDTVQARVL